jgi:hypothetical protein
MTRELYDNKKRALYRKNRPDANNNKKQAQREAEQVVVIYYRRTCQVHNKNNKQAQRKASQVVPVDELLEVLRNTEGVKKHRIILVEGRVYP